MTTARTIVTRALQVIGALVKGEAPSADEAVDGLTAMNMMVSGWSNYSGLVYARAWESFPIIGGVGQYSIGTGQTFNTARPVAIVSSYVRQATIDYPLYIIADENYAAIDNKNIGGIPENINFDNAFPVAQIRLYPVPSSPYTLFILSEKELTQFALDDNVSYPPGWEEALVYNLAIRLAPEYQQKVDPRVETLAKEGKQNIMLAVSRNRGIDAATADSNGVSRLNSLYSGSFL